MENEIPSPVEQTPQNPPLVQNSNRSFWKTLAIGMSIVSFGIALAVGGYFLGVNKNKTAEVSTSQITVTPTPTIDPTANWKTYTNSKYGFSLKYPKDYTVQESEHKESEVEVNFSSPDQKPGEEYIFLADGGFINVSVRTAKSPSVDTEFNNVVGADAYIPTKKSQFNLDGNVAIRTSYSIPDDKIRELVVTVKNGKVYKLTVWIVEEDIQSITKVFDQILSTFKFTDSNIGAGCVITGCSGQICSEEDVTTTCEYRAEYACYKTAKCEVQANGKCGWTQTVELTSCLSSN